MKFVKTASVIKKAVDFHGHLGPFLIIGVRMGSIALKELKAKSHSMRAVAETGVKPPVSCIIDGIQVSTGCTLGRGMIEVIDNQRSKVTFFKDDKKLEIELKGHILESILDQLKVESSEKVAERVMELDNDELFLIKSKRDLIGLS